MTIQDRHSGPSARRRLARSGAGILGTALLACLASTAPPSLPQAVAATPAAERHAGRPYCTATALQQYAACLYEVRDDLFSAKAGCLNVSDRAERSECYADALEQRSESTGECREQRAARRNLCAALGEARYDPDFDPANFDSDFDNLAQPNPYRPLGIGYHWSYAGGDETVEIEVLDKTKLIEGVTCIVVNDRVEEDGELVEDTDDWFAQARNGDVWYCGEESKDYEYFDGDDPEEAELVSIDGSFKWGREGDKGGLLFPGMPRRGAVYRQELSLGNAEDAAKVLATHYSYGNSARLDRFVPQAFIQHFCGTGDCVVTAEFSPLEPEALEYKYFALGIGLVLEVDRRSGEISHLVDCNFDARCDSVPAP